MALARVGMGESAMAECPWCGEPIELWLERDEGETLLQDCDVCCRPCVVEIEWSERDEPRVSVRRE